MLIGDPTFCSQFSVATEGEQPAPGTLEAALGLGKLHFNQKEWGKAEAALTEAIKLNPECAEAYHRRAGIRFNAGKVKESLPNFDVAARLDPKNAEVFKNRGIAYLNLLRFDEALADLKHALELDPDHPESYKKVLGETYARRAFEQAQAKKWRRPSPTSTRRPGSTPPTPATSTSGAVCTST